MGSSKYKILNNKHIIITSITILSGVLMSIASKYFVSYLGWISMVGLFYIILKYEMKPLSSFGIGIASAGIEGIILFEWMNKLANNYTGGQSSMCWVLVISSAIIFAIKNGLLLAVFSYILHKKSSKYKTVISALAVASFCVIIDAVNVYIFEETPWLFHLHGYTQSTNLYSSQLVEIAGIGGLTFSIIICNILFASAIVNKNRKHLFSSIAIIILIHLYGFIRVKTFNSDGEKTFKVALICDNTPPNIRWNENEVNSYINTLLKLNKEAIKTNPDLIIWNEGVIPWTYREDDEFLKEILKEMKNSNSFQLISYFTENENGTSYNSAYLISKDGKVEGRYDKTKLLGGLEKPLWDIKNLQLPFNNSNTINKTICGKGIYPIKNKKFDKIGVMICNESVTEEAANKLSNRGAGFIVSMANDNWFANTELISHHFYYTRMHAIEARKDVVVNSNMGISGIIKANGKIELKSQDKKPQLITATVNSSTNESFTASRIRIFEILSSILFILIILNFKKHEKN